MPNNHYPPAIVLVRPQLAENIGAAARAMINFSAYDLRLVEPRPYDKCLAVRMACDGRDIISQSRTFPDLRSALKDCVFTIATSRRLRRIKIPPVNPRTIAARLTALPDGQPTALVFGAECDGLTNQELFLCDIAAAIPTSEKGSLNLGQAVMVFLYEWFQTSSVQARPPQAEERLANHSEKQRVYDLLKTLVLAGDYKPRSRLPEFMRRIKLLFENRALTYREHRILLKLLRHLEKLK
ncbi:RNA methyltransferase [bacterium]|nr:RNA methyltransferase [bacterium]